VRFTNSGLIDAGFGTAGVARDTLAQNASGVALAIQNDGKIVLGGTAKVGPIDNPVNGAVVERFNADGTPDASFANPGLASPLFGGTSSLFSGLALDSNGKIIVAGQEQSAAGASLIAVARLNPNGTLDSSFGSNGTQTLDPGGDTVLESVEGVAIDPIQTILAGPGILVVGTGSLKNSTQEEFLLARFDPTTGFPSPTPAFNHGVVDLIDLQQNGQSNFARGLAVQPDGKFVIAGSAALPGSAGSQGFALARLNPEGTLDTAFGQGGRVITDLGTPSQPAQGLPRSVLVQPDGNIVVTGQISGTGANPLSSAFVVARYVGLPRRVPARSRPASTMNASPTRPIPLSPTSTAPACSSIRSGTTSSPTGPRARRISRGPVGRSSPAPPQARSRST
jgi:uncharacterized delta-60 repeat protein